RGSSVISPSEKGQTCPGSSDGAARSDLVWEGRDGGGLPDSDAGPEVIPERHSELLAGFHQAQERVPAVAALIGAGAAADLSSRHVTPNVILRAVGVQRDLRPLQHAQQLRLVGLKPGQQTIEHDKAGPT